MRVTKSIRVIMIIWNEDNNDNNNNKSDNMKKGEQI